MAPQIPTLDGLTLEQWRVLKIHIAILEKANRSQIFGLCVELMKVQFRIQSALYETSVKLKQLETERQGMISRVQYIEKVAREQGLWE
jgi:hypothetical protein